MCLRSQPQSGTTTILLVRSANPILTVVVRGYRSVSRRRESLLRADAQ